MNNGTEKAIRAGAARIMTVAVALTIAILGLAAGRARPAGGDASFARVQGSADALASEGVGRADGIESSDHGGPAGLSVISRRTGCQEGRLFARWRVQNTSGEPGVPVLRAALAAIGSDFTAVSAPESVALGVGETRDVVFAFPREAADEDAEVVLAVRRDGSFDEVDRAAARFPCLRACPAAQVVVRRSPTDSDDDESVCPPRGDWVGSIAARDREHAYCSYSWRSAPNRRTPDLDLFSDLEGDAWEKDCLSIGAAAALSTEALAIATEARLGVDDLNVQFAAEPARAFLPEEFPVRLAVVDTAANDFDDLASDDTSDHGRVVGLVAHRTACGDAERCPVAIENQPALRVVYTDDETGRSYEIEPEDGGYIGSQGHIARAINRTLRNWDPDREHLVINLSLGWHSKWTCQRPGCGQSLDVDLPSELRVPNGTPTGYGANDGDGEAFGLGTRAVLVAIARARCLGALVFAAVGNAVGGNDAGPLTPAAWNDLDASKLDCARAFDGRAAAGEPRGGLVKAVAAVNFEGRRVALSRKRSLPFLVAHGVGIAVRDGRPRALADGGFTGPLSGSSLATAIAAGGAARAWALLGSEASADDVFERLYEAGTAMLGDVDGEPEPRSDLCGRAQKDGCRIPHEVDACTAFRALAASEASLPPPQRRLSAEQLEQLGEALVSCSAERASPRSSAPENSPHRVLAIGPGSADAGSGAPLDAEPPIIFDPVGRVDVYEAPFSQPQPSPIKCATCALYRDSSLYRLDFDVAFAEDGSAIDAAYIHIQRPGYSPMGLSPQFITPEGWVKGLVDLTGFDVGTAPVSLIVEFEPTADGIPVSAAELVDTLIEP